MHVRGYVQNTHCEHLPYTSNSPSSTLERLPSMDGEGSGLFLLTAIHWKKGIKGLRKPIDDNHAAKSGST